MRLLVAGLSIMIATVAHAESFTVPGTGALRCDTVDDLQAFLTKSLTGEKADASKCAVIEKGAVIDVIWINAASGMRTGMATSPAINGGKPFAVLSPEAAAAETPAAQPKAADETRVYKQVSPADVAATPTKWMGRDLEFKTVQVYWVDDDDVRLLTSQMMTIFVQRPRGSASDVEYFRKNCETSKEATSPKCRARVRFNYSDYGTDKPNGYMLRTVLKSSDAVLTRPPSR